MGFCTAIVLLLSIGFELPPSDGKRKKGQHPKTAYSVKALSVLGKSSVLLSDSGECGEPDTTWPKVP